MQRGDEYLFVIHQFVAALLSLIFIYCAWKDLAAKTYDQLIHVSKKTSFYLLTGIFLGLFFYFLFEWGPGLIILSFTYALFFTLLLYDPKFAVSFFIFLLISRPWEFYKNELMNSILRDAFVLCISSFIVHKVIRKKFYYTWNFGNTMILFFSIWAFVSILASGDSSVGLDVFGEVFVKNIIIYFLIVNVIDKSEFIFPIQSALVLGITEKAFTSFYRSIILGDVAAGGRLQSTGILENSNDIAAILILSVPFIFVFTRYLKSPYLKVLINLLLLAFYGELIWQAKSRGAFLGVGALIATSIWLIAKNKKAATIALVGILAVTISLMSLIKRDEADVAGSTENRKIFWQAGIKMGLKNPLFGIGYAGYNNHLFEYADGNVGSEGSNKTAHSTWILALAETGVVGSFFYLGVWIYALVQAWRMRELHPEYILAMLSYGTAITFLSHTYILYVYILLGLVVASGQLYKVKTIPSKGLLGALYRKGYFKEA